MGTPTSPHPERPGEAAPAASSRWSKMTGRVLTALDLGPWEALGAAVGLGLVLVLNARLDYLWDEVPLWLPLLALLGAVLLRRRVPLLVTILWAYGLATYLWSAAPGDTLLASVWALSLLAAAGLGASSWLVLLGSTAVLLHGLENALTLNAFGLEAYRSGSIHYLTGAVALVVLAPAVAVFAGTPKRWLAVAAWALATVAAFAAFIAGSRGVMLPLAVIVVALGVRLARRGRRRRLLVGALLAVVMIAGADRLIPFHPVATALYHKESIASQAKAVSQAGAFTDRLRFWDQGLGMAVEHPLGVGFGGFRSTIHAFQRFPMLWSSSPHDIFVEWLATSGWPGLALLVSLVVSAFLRAWRSDRWPWALSLLGIWFTLSVDVTADFVRVLVLAFAVLGACYGPRSTGRDPTGDARVGAPRLRTGAVWGVAAIGLALTAWWFAPCSGPLCSLNRWRGVPVRAVPAVQALDPGERGAYFQRLERLYPLSLWVLRLEQSYAATPAARLELARRIATDYPLQTWRNYLTWAELSLKAGDLAQAKEAVRKGLAVFGPDARRYPEMRADPSGFQQWLAEAERIRSLSAPGSGAANSPGSR